MREGRYGACRASYTGILTAQLCAFLLLRGPLFDPIWKDGRQYARLQFWHKDKMQSHVESTQHSSWHRAGIQHIIVPSSYPLLPTVGISCSVSLMVPIAFVVNTEKLGVGSFRSKDELTQIIQVNEKIGFSLLLFQFS